MASSKVYRISYDKKRIEPLLGLAVSSANPFYYISFFLLVLVIVLAYRFRDGYGGVAVVLFGIPVYIAVGIYASNVLMEYSRRQIPKTGRMFSISRKKVVFHQPTYNPSRVNEVVLKRSEIKRIDLTFISKKKIADMEFQMRDGRTVIFMAEMLDRKAPNLLNILQELDYPLSSSKSE
jgi:hypothetical protein